MTSSEAAKLSGVSIRQIQYWDEQGVFCPSQDRQRRQPRVYQPADVLALWVIKRFREAGVGLGALRRADVGRIRKYAMGAVAIARPLVVFYADQSTVALLDDGEDFCWLPDPPTTDGRQIRVIAIDRDLLTKLQGMES